MIDHVSIAVKDLAASVARLGAHPSTASLRAAGGTHLHGGFRQILSGVLVECAALDVPHDSGNHLCLRGARRGGSDRIPLDCAEIRMLERRRAGRASGREDELFHRLHS